MPVDVDSVFKGIFTGVSFFFVLSVISFVLFALFVGFMFYMLYSQKRKNDHSPKLTVPATVISRNSRISSSGGKNRHVYTHYYATFQVESGDRMELHIDRSQYGLIVEGDRGMLTFQGTRFLDFKREF